MPGPQITTDRSDTGTSTSCCGQTPGTGHVENWTPHNAAQKIADAWNKLSNEEREDRLRRSAQAKTLSSGVCLFSNSRSHSR